MSGRNAAVYAQRPYRLADVVSLFPNGYDLIASEVPELKPPNKKYVRRPNRLQSARPPPVEQPKVSNRKRLHRDSLSDSNLRPSQNQEEPNPLKHFKRQSQHVGLS